jgi:lipopolysaccharide transport system ATP-binding protein
MVVNGRLSALIEVGAGFHPDLTGRENVYLNGAILGMKKQEIDRKLDEIIAFSGIEDFIDTPVKRYSSGMYARLGFSVAAHVDPDVLLIDEVLSVGDFPFQTKCLNKMRETVAKGTTVIFISHNIPSVIQLCPRSILLNKGEIQRFGPSASVCRFYHRAYAEANRVSDSIHLDNIELLSEEGTPQNAFASGEWATAKVAVTSAKALSGLIMGFLIKRDDGVMMFDGNSDKVADKYFSLTAGERKTITVGFRANLPQGTYFLGLHFLTPVVGFHLYNDEGLEFHVTGPKTLGQAFVDTRWE